MKTLIITGNDVRNDIEEKTISNWVAEYLKREMCRHRDAKILDHPDKSVTSTKIADNAITQNKIINGAVTTDKVVNRCITRSKLSNDVVGDLKKASMFIYYDGEPVYLSECRYLTGLGYGFPEDIPINVLFKLENDTNNSLSEFRIHDEHYTPLSCTIAPGETRICVLVREEISGADPQNGYLFVLDDSDVKKMISSETKQRQSADNALQRGIDAETKSRQMGDSELQTKIDTETADRKTSDGELNGKKADKTELYGTDKTTKHTVTYSLTAADMAVSIDAGHSKGTVTVSGSTVKEKILLDGNSIQAAELSAMFGCGKGEDGDKYICIYYSPETGTLTMTVEDVETSPEEGTIALMTVGYNTATVTTMYNRAQTFTGINNLNGLKTNNKNSFLEAVNEISTKLTTEISDREDAEHSLTEKISTEISDRQAADNELKAKISEINTELTTDNLFFDLSKYVGTDNILITDDNGVQYLSYSGTFDGAYLYHNFVCDKFRRKPKIETALKLIFNVASRHIAGTDCDSGGLNIGETDVLITYTDTTTETFGQSYYTVTDTGDKTITINGTSETYKTTKFKIEIPVNKEIKSISFQIISDNFYTNGDTTGNACKQKTLIQSAVCYDDECVAVLRDDINANTSKITANTTKITEIDKTVTDISKNQIFVQCDGDHDELKLQAAIDSAPYKSIIYPVGELCVITNANMMSGYGMTGTNNGVAIPLKGGMTLDGSMCDTIMFKNTNPAEKQYIFHLPGNAILKNVKFCEDTDTVTADTVNPAVLYAFSDSKIMHCIFYDIFGTHQFSIPTFKFGTVLFAYNDISSFNGAPANNLTNEITFGSNSVIVGNTFNDITQKEQSLGNMLVVNRSLFQNNYMGGFDNCNITLSGSVVGNIIKSFDDCSIKITGEFVANDISVVAQNTKTSFLSTTPYTIISGNVMKSISIENEYINIIECSSYAVISDNYFYVGSIPATGECALIWSTQQNIISDNIFRTGTSVKDNSDFAIIDGDGNTMVKDNLTNATSLGTFEDTCVVEGNVTGGNA
jgi:hypothetical protein